MTAGGFAGLDPCVHCGFCLQSCPTFLVTGDEADSPRGRIVLMRALAQDERRGDDAFLQLHLDRCLGCRGCEPACPSGVRYGPALEAAREVIGRTRRVPLAARTVLTAMAEPLFRTPAMALARMVRPLADKLAGRSRVGFAMGMLAATRNHQGREREKAMARESAAPAPITAPSVALFQGCIMSGLFSHVHDATARTLTVNGYRMVEPPAQGCCGPL